VNGRPWQEAATEEIANSREYFEFAPGQTWHGFEGYIEKQYFVDPNKLLLTTPRLDTNVEQRVQPGQQQQQQVGQFGADPSQPESRTETLMCRLQGAEPGAVHER
jgi:hypothetical protein